ncbi:MAG: DNRLRE domain-containing protein [Bacteroidota bacterium]|nr:DNRLRE domain-containing protein [Bacteroidota bacterium]
MKGNQFTPFVILIILLFVNSSLEAQTTVSIRLGPTTGQDIMVLSNHANINLNGHPDYLATIWTAHFDEYLGRTYFQFYLNQIPTGANITDARLSLYANPNPTNPSHSQLGGDNTSYLYRVQTPWDENNVTWNTQPEYSTLHKITIPPTNDPNQDYPNLDVTQMVRDMFSHPNESYGFMLVTNTEWFFWYRSMNFAPSTVSDTLKRPLLQITYDNPLAVELSSFTSATNGRNTTLDWTTSTEENNSGFEILRALNENSDFTKIGFVTGNGTTKSQTNYFYEDRNLTSGRYKYRLKQIDYNGNFKYYELSNDVTIGVPDKFSLSQNYPNPFNPTTKINFDIPQDGMVTLKVYDMTGREVKSLVSEFKIAGYYSVDFSGNNLSSGAYFYKLESGNFEASKNMILVK